MLQFAVIDYKIHQDDYFSRPISAAPPIPIGAPGSIEHPRGVLGHAVVVAGPKAKGAAKVVGSKGKGKAKAKAVGVGGSSALRKALAAPPSVTAPTSDDDFPPPPEPLPASASASSSGAAAPKRARGAKRDAKQPYPSIGGPAESQLIYDEYRTLKGAFNVNWEMQCHHHHKCSRVRGVVPANCRTFGEDEPVAFLHAWRDTPPAPGKTHRGTDPTDEAVSAFYHEHKEELVAYVRP